MRLPFGKPERMHVGVDLLSAYLDNQGTPAERTRVDGHLNTCVACRGELESLRQTTRLVQALPRVPVPRAFTLSEAQVGIRRRDPQPAWGNVLRGLGAVAAVALVAVVAASLLNRPAWQPAAMVALNAPAPEAARQEAPPAESAPAAALALAPAPAEPTALVEKPAERAVAPTEDAPTLEAAPAALAPQATTAPQKASQPPAAPTAAKVAATETPGLVAAAAQATPSAGVMAFGRGGGAAGAAEMSAQALSPEPTPPLAPIKSVLPAEAGFAYADEAGLWAIDGESGARQLVTGEGLSLPIISSDRAWVAYRVAPGDYSEIWAVRWDGTDAGLLLSERELPATDLPTGYSERRLNDVRWLPGRAILALTTVAVPNAADLLPKLELWHLDVESGVLQRVTDMGRAVRPFYSPDGSEFALLQYGTESDPTGTLTLISADGADRRVVLRFPAGPDTYSADSQITWLPDGSSLWAFIPESSPTDAGPQNGATLYRVSTGESEAQSAGRVDAFQVFWAPDGAQLAYTRALADGALDLFLANADGSNPQRYASLGNGGFTNWSPDGTRFTYFDGTGQVYAGAPDQAPQPLGKSNNLVDPRWISSRQVLALHDAGTNWLLVARALDGDTVGLQPLSRNVTYDVTPGLSK